MTEPLTDPLTALAAEMRGRISLGIGAKRLLPKVTDEDLYQWADRLDQIIAGQVQAREGEIGQITSEADVSRLRAELTLCEDECRGRAREQSRLMELRDVLRAERDEATAAMFTSERFRAEDAASHIDDQIASAEHLKAIRQQQADILAGLKALHATWLDRAGTSCQKFYPLTVRDLWNEPCATCGVNAGGHIWKEVADSLDALVAKADGR